MKIFRAISGFLLLSCIVVLTSCATHSKPATTDAGSADAPQITTGREAVLSESLGKTMIDVPRTRERSSTPTSTETGT